MVDDEASLNAALAWRDACGGAMWWLAHDAEFPVLGIRVSGNVADVTCFPADGHPGFRCVGGVGLPDGGSTTLVYDGCDPASGECTPNKFIVSLDTVHAVAREFQVGRRMSNAVRWFEL